MHGTDLATKLSQQKVRNPSFLGLLSVDLVSNKLFLFLIYKPMELALLAIMLH